LGEFRGRGKIRMKKRATERGINVRDVGRMKTKYYGNEFVYRTILGEKANGVKKGKRSRSRAATKKKKSTKKRVRKRRVDGGT